MATANPLPFAPEAPARPSTKRAELEAATARLRARGIDDEAAFVGPIDEALAWLETDEPCESPS